jgi:DNA-binding GntR family transcriptional regulator
MEGLAARLAARVRSDLDIAVLDGLLSLTREAAEAGDVNRLIELNHAFHETIWRVARNRFLTRQLLLLRDLIERRQDSTLYDASRQREMVDEHTAIAAAIAEQNPDAAQRVALAHLHRATALRLINQRSRQRGSDSR